MRYIRMLQTHVLALKVRNLPPPILHVTNGIYREKMPERDRERQLTATDVSFHQLVLSRVDELEHKMVLSPDAGHGGFSRKA